MLVMSFVFLIDAAAVAALLCFVWLLYLFSILLFRPFALWFHQDFKYSGFLDTFTVN